MSEPAAQSFDHAGLCSFCGEQELVELEGGEIFCGGKCCQRWTNRAAYVKAVEAEALRFAIENPGLRDGTVATRERLRGIFVALLRGADLDLVEKLAVPIGRLADFHDATSRAILDDAARAEAERLRTLRRAS